MSGTIPRRHAFLRELAGRPRHEILERTGGRGTRSMVKLLGRLVPERLELDVLRRLTREGLPAEAEKAGSGRPALPGMTAGGLRA